MDVVPQTKTVSGGMDLSQMMVIDRHVGLSLS